MINQEFPQHIDVLPFLMAFQPDSFLLPDPFIGQEKIFFTFLFLFRKCETAFLPVLNKLRADIYGCRPSSILPYNTTSNTYAIF